MININLIINVFLIVRCLITLVSSESLIKRTANYMAHNGYLDAGYEYIIIDDCWSEMERDKNNRLVPDHERFPSGMKALADYV